MPRDLSTEISWVRQLQQSERRTELGIGCGMAGWKMSVGTQQIVMVTRTLPQPSRGRRETHGDGC